MKHRTQGRELIAKLRNQPMTYREMLQSSRSCSPWKRVRESLYSDEYVLIGRDFDGHTTWRVCKVVGS